MEHILDHVARAIARLPAQFQGKATHEAVVRLLASESQVLEDVLWDVLSGTVDGDVSPNLLWNSSFEIDTDGVDVPDGWAVYNNSAGTEPTTAAVLAGDAVAGDRFFRVMWSASNTSTKGIRTTTALGGGLAAGWIAGQWYTLSWWARASGTAVGKTMATGWNAGPNEQVAIMNPPLAAAWQRYAFRFRWTTSGVPGTTAGAPGELYLTVTPYGVACTGSIDFDAIQVETGTEPSDYQPSERESYRPHLDAIGRIVGQPREGRADDRYRVWLKGRIRLNRSCGTGPDLIDTFLALTAGACRVTLTEPDTATIVLRLDGAPIASTDVLSFADVLQHARAGGVRAFLEWIEGTDANALVLADGQVDSTLAVASAANATTVTLASAASFPPAPATVIVDPGLAQEIRTYTARGANDLSFPGAPLASAHAAGAMVILLDESAGKGLGDAINSTAGGELAGAR